MKPVAIHIYSVLNLGDGTELEVKANRSSG
jgi:hypothetical protein